MRHERIAPPPQRGVAPALRRWRARAVPVLRRRVLFAPRHATGALRALPDFVVLGAMKSGTTSLAYYLAQHPQVRPAYMKGVHFFDSRFERGLDWYRAHFPLRADLALRERLLGRPVMTGEASPYYLAHPRVPERLHRTLPEAKLIAIVRDPVARAFSHYNHNLRKGADRGELRETLPFAEAVAREEERLEGEAARMLADPTYKSAAYSAYSYKTRGRYAEQLERFAARFPREQILVVQSEAFYADVQGELSRVLTFLGLDRWAVRNPEPKNSYGYRTPPMDPEVRAELQAYFRPHNERLYDFVGRDFGW